jgi:hypothetical protein
MGYTKHTFTTINGVLTAVGVHIPPPTMYGRLPMCWISLHGQGVRGSRGDITTVNGIDRVPNEGGVPSLIKNVSTLGEFKRPGGNDDEAIGVAVFFMQCSTEFGTWPVDYVKSLIAWIKANYSTQVDTNRIILEGLSQGGGGVLGACADATIAPHVAAAFSICPGYYAFNYAGSIVMANSGIPIKIYHSATDTTANPANTSRIMVTAINLQKPVWPLQYIEFAGNTSPNDGTNGHNIWSWVQGITNRNVQTPLITGDTYTKKYLIFEEAAEFTAMRYRRT